MLRCFLVIYLFFTPFVYSQTANNCPDTSLITDSILQNRVDQVINGAEPQPGTDIFLENSYINCLSHDTYPNNYSYVGISVLYEQGGDGMDFSYIRLVYSCSGSNFIFEPSLSDTIGTPITGINPVFLNDTFQRDDCYSCNVAVSSNEYICEECDMSCQTPDGNLGFCQGPFASDCCRYTFSGVCVSVCPGGFTPAVNNTCICNTSCQNSGTLNASCLCECPLDYFGVNCENQYLPCDNSPCVNGMCIDGVGVMRYTCTCHDGYEGVNCDLNIDDCDGDPCSPGVCGDSINSYTCSCPSGYTNTGLNCTNINECDNNPCQNNGECNDTLGGYSCTCQDPYDGTNCTDCTLTCQNEGVVLSDCTCDCSGIPYEGKTCGNESEFCIPNPCLNNGECTNGVDTFSCDCPTPYTGITCSECGINTCGNGTIINCACVCYSGHTGDFCQEDIIDCTPNLCQNSGKCIEGNNTYTCDCSGTGYEGDNCEVDPCSPDPCLNNGVCTNSSGDFSCECIGGFTGKTCAQCLIACQNGGDVTSDCTCDCSDTGHGGMYCEIDPCSPDPCLNNGVCTNSGGDFSCECIGGFTGPTCAQCPIVCEHGGDVIFDCTCDCSDTGYEGTKCKEDINECLITPSLCLNGGLCQNTQGSYYCICEGGYSGEYCAHCPIECLNGGEMLSNCTCDCTNTDYVGWNCGVPKNKCVSEPCVNGECSSTDEDYSCNCTRGFTGKNCSECLVVCQNGGERLSDCTCDCSNTRYEGTKCQNDINECPTTPSICLNGGECLNTQGSYTCICASGFTGNNCSNDIDECDSTPCDNGNCTNTLGSFFCDCHFGFEGQFCDSSYINCSDFECQNGGECKQTQTDIYCVCEPGFTGDNCEILSCTDGFDSLNDKCVNINECKRYPKVCGVFPAVCTDNIPLYTCGCPDGYNTIELTSALDYCDNTSCIAKQCIDINECSENTHDCHQTQVCVNTNGSYHCSCLSGFLQSVNICILQIDAPDCPVDTDGHGNIWPGANQGSIVSLKCPNSDYGVATRRCVSACSCSSDPPYWEIPEHSQCRSVGLRLLAAELEAINTFQYLNLTEFMLVVNRIQIFATNNQIREHDVVVLTEILQEICDTLGKFNTSFFDLSVFIDMLKIADTLLTTEPKAWNELRNVTGTILSIHDMILITSHGIAKYLYSIESIKEFNFNSNAIDLSLTKYENYTNNDFVPDPNLRLILPIITPDILNLTPQRTPNCHIFVRTLHLPTLHHILNNFTSTPLTCGTTTTTRSLIYPIDLFTFGIHSLSCDIPTPTFRQTNPIIYRVKMSILPYKTDEASYHLNYVSSYSQYVSQLNSFAPSGCRGPFIELGDLLYFCYSLKDYILTLQIPGNIPYHASALGIILRVFYPLSVIVSVIGLAILFSKYVILLDGMTFVRINVIVTIIISQFLFTIGIDRNESHIVCTIFRFVLHYLSLSTCLWSLIDIINVCLIAVFDWPRVAVNSTYLVVGYIVPLAPVVLAVVLSSCTYFRVSNFCFPSTEESSEGIWYIIAPLFVLILLYICLLIGVIVVLCYKRDNIRVELENNRLLFVRIIASSFTLPVVLLIWWISTVYAFPTDSPNLTFQIISLVIGSLIGMFLSFVYLIASAEQIIPIETGRNEGDMIDFTHGAMARVSYNPIFRDTDSLNDIHSLIDTRETVLSYN
ncbi:Neurogenic locus Notch protein-like [Oopsacas minuta]|uniref:Neurogenic locus Notch protein-like n=1 Tax=Oopsacas minuta TaxID=111878 RepID=A0AAV7KSC9_9METZ|nr:Neurogenic locus Notch protein-like [Oopsacas minuta]